MNNNTRTQSDLDTMLAKGAKMLSDIGIPISESVCPRVKIVAAHSFFGKCCHKDSNLKHFPAGYDYLIKVSKYTLGNSEKSVMNTLLHELIHTCPDCIGHDAKWRKHAAKANAAYGYDIKRVGGDKTEQDTKNLNRGYVPRRRRNIVRYLLTCPRCGREWHYATRSRAVQFPDKCTCPYCKKKGLSMTDLTKPIF